MIISLFKVTVSLFFFHCFYLIVLTHIVLLFNWPLMIISVLRTTVSLLFFYCSCFINHLWLTLCLEPLYQSFFFIVLIWLITYDYFYLRITDNCSFLIVVIQLNTYNYNLLFVPIWLTTYDYLCFKELQFHCSLFDCFYLIDMIIFVLKFTVW